MVFIKHLARRGRLILALLFAIGFLSIPQARAAFATRAVHATGYTGLFISMALDAAQRPIISFFDFSTTDLQILFCADRQCSAATVKTLDLNAGAVGRYGSLVLNAAGHPVVSYYDSTGQRLKLAICADPGCDAVTTVILDDSAADVGQYTSLQLSPAGNPMVSYWDVTNRDLKLAVCADPMCSSVTTTVVDGSASVVGEYSSMQLNAAGNPVIAYLDGGAFSLKIATCNAPTCSAPLIRTLDPGPFAGLYPSLRLDAAGNPVVAYAGNSASKIVQCQDATCTASTIHFLDQTTVGVGIYASLRLLSDGRPIASYFNSNGSDLRVASCVDVACSAATVEVVASAGSIGYYSSLRLVGDRPVIASHEGNNGDLMFSYKAPGVTSVSVPASGTYRAGQNLDFAVHWDEPVTVVGAPTLGLTLGSGSVNASYLGGSGGTELTFRYTVQPGDIDADGIAVGALGAPPGTIHADGYDALPALNGVGSTAGILVDTAAPGVVSVAPPPSGNYLTGQAMDFSVSFDEPVTVDASAGTPRLELTVGAASVFADYVAGSGSATLVFRHTVAAGENDNDGIAVGALQLNGGTLADAASNPAAISLAGVGSTVGVLVNRSYQVTASAGSNGSIVPAGTQAVAQGASLTFSLAPQPGYAASVGGTCGGTLAGNTFTTAAIVADCTVVASFALVPVRSYTGPSATGEGAITASFTGGGATCSFDTPQYIPLTGHAHSPPAGSAPPGEAFPHGLFDFRAVECGAGETITMTITYPSPVPPASRYWKYGPTPSEPAPHWYILPATIAGATVTFSITDGGLGDDDLAANGTIVDPGGIGYLVSPVPVLSAGAVWLLALMLVLLAVRQRY
ncbi:choice-of-anchor U domain-containing protein [Acidovorax sp. M2(2025)]|uniref:choice-of-anchor U domain-containing protein n=1 Tax=Acidovorax sp. M2(2025) TaxID=3411355 RepID=UPI003BF4E1BF